MKVLVTGSRDWEDRALIRAALKAIGATIVIHGAQAKKNAATGEPMAGADWHAKMAANELGIPNIPYPAFWGNHGKAAGPIRNQKMIDENPDIGMCLAFPLPGSRGTWDCVERADKAGIPVRVCGDTGLRRRDTPEDRAFWKSVDDAAEEWEAAAPNWSRKANMRNGSPESAI
jgi:hypothetical protein